MKKEACPRCGAPGDGFICAYCGAELHAPGDDRAEMSALDQYHRHIEAAGQNQEQCSRLIIGGFVPSGQKALIEAGLRCIARIDIAQPFSGCNEQWVRRLEAISPRLRVMAGEDAQRAVGEFDARAQAWRVANERETKIALSFFAGLCLAIVMAGWWLYHRFWP